jgi:hypothetical protein
MSINDDEIVKAFEELKSKGLTYHDATLKLQQSGYSKQEIIDAGYYSKYTADEFYEHSTGIDQGIHATFAEAASKQRSINRLEDKMNMDMIKRHYPIGGTFWGIKSIFSWANYTSAKHSMPKWKVYLAYALAVIGFNLLLYISVTILITTSLPMFLIIICFILCFLFAQYCLARYFNSK